jgi:hypothetical protein
MQLIVANRDRSTFLGCFLVLLIHDESVHDLDNLMYSCTNYVHVPLNGIASLGLGAKSLHQAAQSCLYVSSLCPSFFFKFNSIQWLLIFPVDET